MRVVIAPYNVGVTEVKDDTTGEVKTRSILFTEHLTLPNGQVGPPNVQVEVGPYDQANWDKLVEFFNNPTDVAERDEAASKIITPSGPLH